MRISRGISIILALLVIFAMASVAFAEKAPVGSFAVNGVSTISDLINELKDPTVAARYEAVYNIPASQLVSQFKDYKLTTLKSPIETSVYYIDRSGKIASKTQILPQGTAVFADKNGNPAISWWTGNPLGSQAIGLISAAGAGAGAAIGAATAASWVAPAVGIAAAAGVVIAALDDDPIPEPAGIIALATGIAGLPIIRRIKKS
jgi:hypothetical protein